MSDTPFKPMLAEPPATQTVDVILGPGYQKGRDTHGMWHASRKLLTAVYEGKYRLEVRFKRKITKALHTYLWLNNNHKICERTDDYLDYEENGTYISYTRVFEISHLNAGDTISLPKHMEDIEYLEFRRESYSFYVHPKKDTYKYQYSLSIQAPVKGTYCIGGKFTVDLEAGANIRINDIGTLDEANQMLRLNLVSK